MSAHTSTHTSTQRTITLVRHGQASLGAANYDLLSELGVAQAQRLGAYLAGVGTKFDAVYLGTLVRHEQTRAAIAEGATTSQCAAAPLSLQSLWDQACEPIYDASLNEYDSEAVIAAHIGQAALEHMRSVKTPEGYRAHFVTLRLAIAAWMQAKTTPVGMPTYAAFAAGVMRVLGDIQASGAQHSLVVSSGGPLSSALAQVLGMSHEAGIELNMRMRNTAVSELVVTPKRLSLLTFNHLPHLDDAQGRAMQTYA